MQENPYQLGREFDIMPIPPIPEHCTYIPAGAVTFAVEYRLLNEDTLQGHRPEPEGDAPARVFDDRGVTLHVFDAADGREYLRFDCFEEDPHYHYIQHHRQVNVVVRLDTAADGEPLPWALERLRTRLPEMLRQAGAADLADRVEPTVLAAALSEVVAVAEKAGIAGLPVAR